MDSTSVADFIRPLVLSFFIMENFKHMEDPHGPNTNITILPVFSCDDLFLILALFSIEV